MNVFRQYRVVIEIGDAVEEDVSVGMSESR